MRRLLLVPLLLLAPVGAASSDGGPSPGLLLGGEGVRSADGLIRYVAAGAGSTTNVTALGARDNRFVTTASVPGAFGVPLVTQNGEAGGLSLDGRTLILATWTNPGAKKTKFAVLDTKGLQLKRIVTLKGSFSYDALSPDAKTMFAIEYVPGATSVRYRVRAVDLTRGRLLPGVIADKRLWGDYMRGFPVARATAPDGGWVYTLYGKADGTAFVHMLDARHRGAICVNLPWRNTQKGIGSVKLSLEGTQLVLTEDRFGRLAAIDTTSFAVRTFREPADPGVAVTTK
jgi:hypothetical protein